MKRLRVLLFALLVAESAAQLATAPPPQNDPFVGTWQKKQGTKVVSARTIARDGEELIFSSRDEDRKPKELNYRIRCDALFHPVPFGSLSCRYTAPNVVEGESREKRKPTVYWRREVSVDGQEMVISGGYTDSGRTTRDGWSSDVLYRVK
jgi:hypothetical protein